MIRARIRAALAVVVATVMVTVPLASRAVASDAPPPAAPQVDELLRQSGDTSGVWELVDNNRAHHLQSGLVCEAAFFSFATSELSKDRPVAMLPLQSVSVVASDRPRGDDVACNYGASNGPLVVIEAIRLRKGEDAGDILNDMRKLLASKYEGFHHVDFPIRLSVLEQGELGKETRYQHYDARLDGKKYLATIWVGPVRHWAVVIYAVGISDNIILQHAVVDTQWLAAARWVLATSISRGEPAPD
ncbi:MAG: hypothetical protein GC190_05825 [Alphaproteobacteria bacterium]|nr:hypothetical protein [Alphaproteobacteria bacterium]